MADLRKLARTMLDDVDLIEQKMWPRMHEADIAKLSDVHARWQASIVKMNLANALRHNDALAALPCDGSCK